jgi:hypothetical protein
MGICGGNKVTTQDHAALIAELSEMASIISITSDFGRDDKRAQLLARASTVIESLSPPAPAAPVDAEALAHIDHPSDEVWAGCRACYYRLPFPSRRSLTAEEVAERLGIRGYGKELFTVTLEAAGLTVYAATDKKDSA